MYQNRKKGFSMIELILVIAIMGIITASTSIGFSYLKAGNVKSAAKNIDSTLSKLKLDTMSMANKPKMYLYKKGSDYYMLCTAKAFDYNNIDSYDGQQIANENVKIVVDGNELNTYVEIAFKKGSGAFLTAPSSLYVCKSDNKGLRYKIVLVRETGKHYIETEASN